MTGKIVRLIRDRGFGFICEDGKTLTTFFHCTAIDDALPFDATLEGRRVTYDVIDTEKGAAAVNIRCGSTDRPNVKGSYA